MSDQQKKQKKANADWQIMILGIVRDRIIGSKCTFWTVLAFLMRTMPEMTSIFVSIGKRNILTTQFAHK